MTGAAMKLRLHFVVDPMGWLCISVVLGIWLYNSILIPKLVLLPHYDEGHIPWAIVFCEISLLHLFYWILAYSCSSQGHDGPLETCLAAQLKA